VSSGNRCPANRRLRVKLFADIDKLKETKTDFSLHSLAMKYDIEKRRVAVLIRERDDIYVKKVCRSNGVGSIWGFRDENQPQT
jgi:hypothetical protein